MARKAGPALRLPAERAAYAELMALVDHVVGADRRRRMADLVDAYVLFCAGRARAILTAALCDPATPAKVRAEIAGILAEHPQPSAPKEPVQ